ncbi:MAG: hypothetical protein AB7O47_08100 [Flavobacteriales bacterium]
MKKITTLILLLIVIKAFSQEKGAVFLSVFPENAIIRLNDSLLKSQQTYTLDTGNYNVKMWLPTREYVERTINIKEAQTTRLHEVLSYSDDYKKYLRKKRMYHLDKIVMRYVPPIALGYVIYNTISINNKISDEKNLANEAKTRYENASDKQLLTTYKNEYSAHKTSYDENVDKYNKSIIIGSVLVISTAALQYFSYKLKKPEYTEKTLLSSFSLNSYNNQVIPSVMLTYKIK